MKAKETLKLTGILKIEKVFPDGTRETVLDAENLITLASKQAILSGIYLPNVTSDPVTQLKVGTGGTLDSDGQFPRTVTPSASSLTSLLTSISTSYSYDATTPSITFIADINQGTANGSMITEAALYKAGGTMFNIKTFPGIPKTSEFSLHFEWTIKMG